MKYTQYQERPPVVEAILFEVDGGNIKEVIGFTRGTATLQYGYEPTVSFEKHPGNQAIGEIITATTGQWIVFGTDSTFEIYNQYEFKSKYREDNGN